MPTFPSLPSRISLSPDTSVVVPAIPHAGRVVSFFKGLKLSLNNTGRRAQWFFAKASCGLISDPYRRKSGDFTRLLSTSGRHDFTVSRNSSIAGDVESRSMVGLMNAAEGGRCSDSDAVSMPQEAADNGINAPSVLSIEDRTQRVMEANAGKRRALGALLKQRSDVIREMKESIRSQLASDPKFVGLSYNFLDGKEFLVIDSDHEQRAALSDAGMKALSEFEGSARQAFKVSEIVDSATQLTFFGSHFMAHFNLRKEADSPVEQLYKQAMEEAYFGIFERLLANVAGKKIGIENETGIPQKITSRCHRIFADTRLDALRQMLEEESTRFADATATALIGQYETDFQNELTDLTRREKNNPLFLKRAHEAIRLKPLPGAEDTIVRLNQALGKRASSAFLLARMACRLIAMVKDECDPGPGTESARLNGGAMDAAEVRTPENADGLLMEELPIPALRPRLDAARLLAMRRENVMHALVEEAGQKLKPTEVGDGDDGLSFLEIHMSEEDRLKIMEIFGKIVERSQTEFLVRISQNPEAKNDPIALFYEHYETAPFHLNAEAVSVENAGRSEILKDAQADCSELLIAACAKKEIGTQLGQVLPGKIEALFCQYFQEERTEALRFFIAEMPASFAKLNISEADAIHQFENDFIIALPADPALDIRDYINDRLLKAHASVQLGSGIANTDAFAQTRGCAILASYMKPSALLARAAVKVVSAIWKDDPITAMILAALRGDPDTAMEVGNVMQTVRRDALAQVKKTEQGDPPEKHLTDFCEAFAMALIRELGKYYLGPNADQASKKECVTMLKDLTATTLYEKYPEFLPDPAAKYQ